MQLVLAGHMTTSKPLPVALQRSAVVASMQLSSALVQGAIGSSLHTPCSHFSAKPQGCASQPEPSAGQTRARVALTHSLAIAGHAVTAPPSAPGTLLLVVQPATPIAQRAN